MRLNSLKVSLYDTYPYIHTTPSSTHIYQPSQFNPKSGPQLGGTEVTITGSNLRAKRSDIQYVRIDGVNCTVINYQPGVRYAELIHLRIFAAGQQKIGQLVLSLPPSHLHILPSPASGVGLRQKSAVLSPIMSPLSLITIETPPFRRNGSLTRYIIHMYVCMYVCMYVYMYVYTTVHPSPIFLQIPSINDPPATPNRGPQSGGTNITIRGRYLGIGSSHNVTLGSHECRIHEIM